jgi:predicted O-linked N-acetylglucosamine transferase (SPINDLY family)
MPLMPPPAPPTPGGTTTLSLQDAMQRAMAACQRGDRAATELLCRAILTADAGHFDALQLLGIVSAQAGRAAEAAELLARAVAARPDRADAHNNRGNVLRDLGRPAEALTSFDRALTFRPASAEALTNRGNALRDLGRHAEAMASYDRALAHKPEHVAAWNNRGGALRALGRRAEALASYDRALSLQPGLADAHSNRGALLSELGRHDEAVAACDRALAARPDNVAAHVNRGVALRALARHAEALASFDRALALAPGSAAAWNNRGAMLNDLGRAAEALASCEQALEADAAHADAWNGRGVALRALKRFAEALASYDRAVAARPDYAEAHYNRANVLTDLERHAEALASYEAARQVDPDCPYLLGDWLHARMRVCDWDGIEAQFATLAQRVARGERASPPFPLVALPASPAVQRTAAETWVRDRHPPLAAAMASPPRDCSPIRLGYFSADLHEHATMRLMAELFECHDRRRFELTAFSFGPETGDPMRGRARAAFDRFVDVRGMSDESIAALAQAAGIDIAVDLKGFTRDARPGVFARRAAPVQVSYLGYPGTMGAPYIDYLVADATLVPEADRGFYCEKIVCLPDCYQVNDTRRGCGDAVPARDTLGLPAGGFVYCCFNSSYKITPATFDGWMRILGAVDGSALWLLADNDLALANLRAQAARRGIDPARLVFAPRLPQREHLARQLAADLFLDTLPCNAHTTASDALWAGLPVLTCVGDTFAGRVAASLLGALRLPELVATTADQYEARAIAFAQAPARLQELRAHITASRTSSPLFDCARFARRLEAAFEAMHARRVAGLPPEHIVVAD